MLLFPNNHGWETLRAERFDSNACLRKVNEDVSDLILIFQFLCRSPSSFAAMSAGSITEPPSALEGESIPVHRDFCGCFFPTKNFCHVASLGILRCLVSAICKQYWRLKGYTIWICDMNIYTILCIKSVEQHRITTYYTYCSKYDAYFKCMLASRLPGELSSQRSQDVDQGASWLVGRAWCISRNAGGSGANGAQQVGENTACIEVLHIDFVCWGQNCLWLLRFSLKITAVYGLK